MINITFSNETRTYHMSLSDFVYRCPCDAAMKNFVFVQTNFIPLQGDMQNTATWLFH